MSKVQHRQDRESLGVMPVLLIPLDARSVEPLHHQVYRGLREAILSGRLHAGVRIPSTRWLAEQLGVSRSTILVAFDQLVAEGYIVGVVGSGSYVARQLPDHLLQVTRPPGQSSQATEGAGRATPIAQRVTALRQIPRITRRFSTEPHPFQLGVPPVDQFPMAVWSRLGTNRYRDLDASRLYHGTPAGSPALREAIAAHHAGARGVRCTPDQVIVLSSAQEAMDLACRVVLNPGDPVWFEEPGYAAARGALVAAGARIVPVPVDAEGLVVERGVDLEPRASLVYVTPSHQCPTGATLSLERRLALLHWAARADAWILEDDYDSEYRYTGRPLAALQGLDVASRVLYIGTFNKTLFPSLRLAYLVVPTSLLEAVRAVRSLGGQHAPIIDQAILTDFLTEGHYARYLRRMRIVCRDRRDALIAAAQRDASGLLEMTRPETGLYAIAWLAAGLDDRRASAAAAQRGIEVAPLSNYYAGPCPRGGLVLGYGGVPPDLIATGMRQLAAALRSIG